MPALRIEALTKSFGGKKILDNISLSTGEGELVVVLGPSGCGKSTILRLIAGLETADSGEIYIGGRRVDGLSPQQRKVALVFQNYALYPHMTVAQNLAFPLTVAKLKKDDIKEKVKKTAELVGLAERLDAKPSELSGGQRQRVALGRAIIRQPDIYLLDEPLSNLDADLRHRMRREIVELQRKLGTTTIYVTHDQTEALTMADRLAVIEAGVIKQIGTPEEVYNHPVDVFVASFLGTPKINLIEGTIADNHIIPFGWPVSMLPRNFAGKDKFIIGIRPEDIIISPEGGYSGIVKNAEYLGDRAVAIIEYDGIGLTAVLEPGKIQTNAAVKFEINRDRVLFFEKR